MARKEEDGPTTQESVFVVALLSLALKLMLLPSSQSEAFAGHRLSLSVAYERNLQDWYDGTKEEVEFSPGFGLFKRALAYIAVAVDGRILDPDDSRAHDVAMVFHRLSVIVTDSFLLLGVLLFCRTWPSTTTTDMEWSRNKVVVVVALTLFNPGLILIDHIYLGYNGCAVGMAIIAISFLRRGDDYGDLLGVVTLIALIMFEPFFVAIVPFFAVYLFRHFCSVPSNKKKLLWSLRRRNSYSPSSVEKFSSLSRSSSSGDESSNPQQRQSSILRRRMLKKEPQCSDSYSNPVIAKADRDRSPDFAALSTGKFFFESKGSGYSQKHGRASSEIPRGFRWHQAYASLSKDASFKNLLEKPKKTKNPEISDVEREVSVFRIFLLLLVIGATLSCFMLPFWWDGMPIEEIQAALMRIGSRKMWSELNACKSYWAPNLWALYMGIDKFANWMGKSFELIEAEHGGENQTRCDLEDELSLHVLPSVHIFWSTLLVLLTMYPGLKKVWMFPHPPVLLPAFIYCMLCYFMAGYHIDASSVLLIIIPLTLASCDSTMDARLYLLLSWIGHVSLLPILKTTDLKAMKPILLLVHCAASYIALDIYHIMARKARRIRPEPNGRGVWLWIGDRMYFNGLALTYVFAEVVHPMFPFLRTNAGWLVSSLETESAHFLFLPLMLISIYCATGMVHSWVLAYQQLVRKVAVIESYKWSPSHEPTPAVDAISSKNCFGHFSLHD